MYVKRQLDIEVMVPKFRENIAEPKSQTSQTNGPYENCSHFWDMFLKMIEKMFKNTFNLCSHIQLNTQNPNTIFKITIYYIR